MPRSVTVVWTWTCVSRWGGEMYSGQQTDVWGLTFSVQTCQTHTIREVRVFHWTCTKKRKSWWPLLSGLWKVISVGCFLKPKWIFHLQINFLNLMACQHQWALQRWFLNACVLLWLLHMLIIEPVFGGGAGGELGRYGASESRNNRYDVKTNGIRVIDFQSNGKTESVPWGQLTQDGLTGDVLALQTFYQPAD